MGLLFSLGLNLVGLSVFGAVSASLCVLAFGIANFTFRWERVRL